MEAATMKKAGRTKWDANLYTTGRVAKVCGVAARTVSKWIDSGKLEGYRIPDSQDRRVTRRALLAFLDSHGFPDEIRARVEARKLEPTVLLVGLDKDMAADVEAMGDGSILLAKDAFAAGLAVTSMKTGVVVVDLAMGRLDAAILISGLRSAASEFFVVAMGSGDDREWASTRAEGYIERPRAVRELVETAKTTAGWMKGGAA